MATFSSHLQVTLILSGNWLPEAPCNWSYMMKSWVIGRFEDFDQQSLFEITESEPQRNVLTAAL